MGARNVFGSCTGRQKSRHIFLIVIGIDNAGKTTLMTALNGEDPALVTPTVGFKNEDIKFNGHDVTVYDLGGGATFRGIWKHYYAEVHGVIFVVDAADHGKLDMASTTLRESMSDDRLKAKPLLVLANKQDKPGALASAQIEKRLKLRTLECPFTVMEIRAYRKDKSHGLDENITKGLKWLTNTIAGDWKNLNDRVIRQTQEQKEREKKEREEKRKRIAAARKEREEAEKAKQAAEGAHARYNKAATTKQKKNVHHTNNHSTNKHSDRNSSKVVHLPDINSRRSHQGKVYRHEKENHHQHHEHYQHHHHEHHHQHQPHHYHQNHQNHYHQHQHHEHQQQHHEHHPQHQQQKKQKQPHTNTASEDEEERLKKLVTSADDETQRGVHEVRDFHPLNTPRYKKET